MAATPTSPALAPAEVPIPAVLAAVQRHWGFDALRPLQAEAIAATLADRDSLVVMPTGGGKSLCYQVPPLLTGRLCVVVSPLISLMEDQVAGLRLAGYPAAALHSNLGAEELADIRRQVSTGELRLLLVAPERLLTGSFISWLKGLAGESAIGSFAIDEAHCISQWGHDFRPEYRRLAELRQHFPRLPLHAYTATATPRVRADIIEQLQLRDPAVLVGRFDRPNLAYRVVPRVRVVDQIAEALGRHRSAEGRQHAAIIYCISRKDTEAIATALTTRGLDARPYHAGLDAPKRAKVSKDFKTERLSIVVATVAFGMGIDRGDVRCVIHAAMPKTIEHYQQETGRAGRDGLPAECILFYSAADAAKWRQIMQFGADESGAGPEVLEAQFALLTQMQRLCTGARCRHKALSEHFGQEYEAPDSGVAGCGACDVCLAELDTVKDATEIARKVLSCVYRVNGSFGAAHIADILRGKATARIVERKHNELSTYGLLGEFARDDILSFINQLIDAGVLERTADQYPVLALNAESASVLRGRRTVSLLKSPRIVAGRAERSARSTEPLGTQEQKLFEALRALRRSIADELNVPPYVVFGDATLEEMARVRPSNAANMATVRGVGHVKLGEFGGRFLEAIRAECDRIGLALDAGAGSRRAKAPRDPAKPAPANQSAAFDMFAEGKSVGAVASQLALAMSTVQGYLAEYIKEAGPESIDPWVDRETYREVEGAARGQDSARLKPIFDKLGGRVPYDLIRLVMSHLHGRTGGAAADR